MCSLFGSCLHQSPITNHHETIAKQPHPRRSTGPEAHTTARSTTGCLAVPSAFHQRPSAVRFSGPVLRSISGPVLRSISGPVLRSGSAVQSELIAAIFRKFPYRCTKMLVSSSAESQMT